jgi:hypothetical protein
LSEFHRFEPSPCLGKRGELCVSGPALVDLLQAVLDKGVPFRFRARGFSMSPFIKDSDVITLFPLSDTSVRLGDVVAFVRSRTRSLIIHRVVGKRDGSFLVAGDGNRGGGDPALELIPEASILGRVTRVERGGKEVSLGLGAERLLIALVTRGGLLSRLVLPVWRGIRRIALFRRREQSER